MGCPDVFSLKLEQVNSTLKIPLNATLLSMMITMATSLINIGSNTALNAIISLVAVSLLSSYIITISCLIWSRLGGRSIPEGKWSLGRCGLAINIASLFFLIPVFFFALWPAVTPVELQTMNWAVVMFGGMIIWSVVYYVIWARYTYTAPINAVDRQAAYGNTRAANMRRKVTLAGAH